MNKNKKRILFLTGTRADFGKLKALMYAVEKSKRFECLLFATGMHVMSRYGMTVVEIQKCGFKNIHTYVNQFQNEPMDIILANTINGLSRYVHEFMPDLIVVHGDRVEALAGAIVGALSNILVAHIEGGEISGSVDELIRHAVSKLSHVHFVANEVAATRLRQLGEHEKSIYVIGSPDIDVMLSNKLPSLSSVKRYYKIKYKKFGIVVFHPVTTEPAKQRAQAVELVTALLESKLNYIVISPNNDEGSEEIFQAYKMLQGNNRFRPFPSMRFEYFLTLIKNASFMIGNSSAGIHEAPVYAVPTINIGGRQKNRFHYKSIIDVACDKRAIIKAINKTQAMSNLDSCFHFGDGNSVKRFMQALTSKDFWRSPRQKQFCDMLPVVIKS